MIWHPRQTTQRCSREGAQVVCAARSERDARFCSSTSAARFFRAANVIRFVVELRLRQRPHNCSGVVDGTIKYGNFRLLCLAVLRQPTPAYSRGNALTESTCVSAWDAITVPTLGNERSAARFALLVQLLSVQFHRPSLWPTPIHNIDSRQALFAMLSTTTSRDWKSLTDESSTVLDITGSLGLVYAADRASIQPELRALDDEVQRLSKLLPSDTEGLLRSASNPDVLNDAVDGLLTSLGCTIWGLNADRSRLLLPPGKPGSNHPRDLFYEVHEDAEM